MNTHVNSAKAQSGIMLLEALIAILIFSLGVLTVVALQATSIKLTSDAKYRTNATLLANKLIGQMWVSSSTLATLKTDFQTDGSAYDTWLNDVKGLNTDGSLNGDGLPGIEAAGSGIDSTLPLVTVDDTAGATAGQVTITLFWRTPEMVKTGTNSRHSHVVTSQIVRNAP